MSSGTHVAIIMDGNGRWAESRGRPRSWGHKTGAETVRTMVEAAPGLGISTLTLYAFSSDNWKRPPGEVRTLMTLFRRHLGSETPRLIREGVRLQVIGRRDRLPTEVLAAMEEAESRTAGGSRLTLRLAIDYSSRDALVAGARMAGPLMATSSEAAANGAFGIEGREILERCMLQAIHADPATPPVDLLIRTGGEQRLSDFMLWECAYAELYFSERMWPEFTEVDLASALREFQGRDRRFGSVRPLAS